jgi:hypothetical protein
MNWYQALWAKVVLVATFVWTRVKAVYLAAENKIVLLDKLFNQLLEEWAKSFISDMASNRNKFMLGLFVAVLLIFKFSGNVFVGLAAFVALCIVFALWIVFYNKNK